MEDISMLEMAIGIIIALIVKNNVIRIIILLITALIVVLNVIIYWIYWSKKLKGDKKWKKF